MSDRTQGKLRVLIADGPNARLEEVASTVASLGHAVIAQERNLDNVAPLTAAEHPDVAIVIVGESEAALDLIAGIVREATCPVIAILEAEDRAFIKEAAKQGIFAYITDGDDPDELQSEIDIALSRFAEYHNLEGAFGRRAITERAKGILMERHSIDEEKAFKLLRDQARGSQRKIVNVAEAVLSSHTLLPSGAQEERPAHEGARDQTRA
ncbi:MAG: ANTAR domain-containing response regulator [Actinomycetota bacterium]